MSRGLRFPIRMKIMLALLTLIGAVVGVITFSTASLFRADKQAYVNGLTAMISLGIAEETHATLQGYRERLGLYARLVLDEGIPRGRREIVSKTMFDEFPELISVEVGDGAGRNIEIVNTAALEASEVAEAELRRRRDEAAAGRVVGDEVRVRNMTFSRKLPCFVMAFDFPDEETNRHVAVTSVLSSERLIGLVSRFTAYESFLTDLEGGYLAHPDVRRLSSRTVGRMVPPATENQESFSAAVTSEYEVQGTTMIGGSADVRFGGVMAVAQVPSSAANLASERLTQRMFLVAVILLVAAIVIGLFLAYRITRPVQRLSAATREVAHGRFEVEVEGDSSDEIGDLAESFNHMTSELRVREASLRDANRQLVQSEKMAAFGQLGAGIAHEVKNPLAGILSCAQLAADDIPTDSPVRQDLKLIEKEARRCKTIIDNLLKFARQEKAERSATDVNAVVLDSIAILAHQMELHEVRVEQELASELPEVLASANQLQQVFMNLMINAQQAMEGSKGVIRIASSRTSAGGVEVRVTDTGPGIPPDVRAKLFEPFFTTKPPGKGTGLGLSVSFGIVHEHGGEIVVESEVGSGATFVVSLPAQGLNKSVLEPAAVSTASSLPTLALSVEGADESARGASAHSRGIVSGR